MGILVEGDSGDNSLAGTPGDDTLNGYGGIDTLAGGDGNDLYIVSSSATVIIEANGLLAGASDLVQFTGIAGDTFVLADNVENLTLAGAAATNGAGNASDNTLVGNDGANLLQGLDGNDTLYGSQSFPMSTIGQDTLVGGNGNDVYITRGAATIVEAAGAAGGIDEWRIIYSSSSAGGPTYTMPDNVENATLLQNLALPDNNWPLNSVVSVVGNDLDNVIIGDTCNNELDGRGGRDTLIGGNGNDIYHTDGNDVLVEQNGMAGGNDTVDFTGLAGQSYTLGADFERLYLLGSAANGTGNNSDNWLSGTSGTNVLTALGGNDTLQGGAGGDTLVGGDGDDVYWVYATDGKVTIVEQAGAAAGYDTVRFDSRNAYQSSFTMPDNVERLEMAGYAQNRMVGVGNALDNVIIGAGREADDLYGGGGADTLIGGMGNDSYYIDGYDDVIVEYAGEGDYDRITWMGTAGQTYVLPDVIEGLTLDGGAATNGTGNASNNIMSGNIANNILDGAGGADAFSGGDGNDIYICDNVNDRVTEQNDSSTVGTADQVRFTGQAGETYVLDANVEILTLLGNAATNGTGNSSNNTITGNDADNVLDGQAGNDTMAGGGGNDTYVANSASDVIRENAASGTDQVNYTGAAKTTFTLAANVENLTLLGTAATNGAGNAGANILVGNAAANVLKGGDGADLLTGGAGVDTLCGNTNTKTDDGDSDRFIYRDVADSGTTKTTQDTIWGYFNGAATGDKIDLSALATGSASDSFTFIGGAAFAANRPGEVRVIKSGADYLVQINTDADSAAEMSILVHANKHTFVAADFIL